MKVAYLHGLESTMPNQDKLSVLESRAKYVYAPTIDYRNPDTFDILLSEIKDKKIDFIVGSSVGGWFAYNISTILGVPTLLFNPAVHNRSINPKVRSGNKNSYHTIVLGTNDKVINPEVSKEWILNNIRKGFKIYNEDIGHRIPTDIFKKYYMMCIDNKLKVSENMSKVRLKTFEAFVAEISGEIFEPKRGVPIVFNKDKHPELAKEIYELKEIAY